MSNYTLSNEVNITLNHDLGISGSNASTKNSVSIPALILYVLGFVGFAIMMFNMSGGLILFGVLALIFYILPVLVVLFLVILSQFAPKGTVNKHLDDSKPFITQLINLLCGNGNILKNILGNFIAPYAFLLFDLLLAVFWVCYPIGIIQEATLVGIIIPCAYSMYYYPYVLIKAAICLRSKLLGVATGFIVSVSLAMFLITYDTFAEAGSIAGIALFFTMITVLCTLAILITNLILSKPKWKQSALLGTFLVLAVSVCVASLVILPGQNEDKYEQAIACVENGDYRQARELFLELGRYEDAEERYNKIKFVKLEVGETIVMGSQIDKPDSSTGHNPLSWTVIAVENGKALLLSDAILTSIDSNSLSTWNESNSVRNKLGDLWYVFDDQEKARISEHSYSIQIGDGDTQVTDKLFLLSREELEKYCSSEQIFSKKDTKYNDYQIIGFGFDYEYTYSYYVRNVDGSGKWIIANCEDKQFETKREKYVGVRPAMYISLDEIN